MTSKSFDCEEKKSDNVKKDYAAKVIIEGAKNIMKQTEKKNKEKNVILILVCIILLLLIFILVHSPKFIFFITKCPKTLYIFIKDILIPLASIGITAVLSFLIWKANLRSADIAVVVQEQDKERELVREKEKVVISATKIYFSMISAFEYLINHYKDTTNERSVYISQNWLDELSQLKKVFSYTEMQLIFKLLNKISVLRDMESHTNYQSMLDQYVEERLIYLLKEYEFLIYIYPSEYLKINDWNIMIKLKKIYKDELSQGIEEVKKHFHEPEFLKTYSNGTTRLKLKFIDDETYTIKVCSETGEEVVNGDVENGIFEGYRIKFKDGFKIEEGKYVDGILYNGKKFHVYRHEPDPYEVEYPEYNDGSMEEYYKELIVVDGTTIINDERNNIEY